MFGKLKNKLKSWAKKISEKVPREKEVKEEKPKLVKVIKKPKKKVEAPLEYDVGKHKFEPDVEKIKEIGEKALEEPEEILEEKPEKKSFFKKIVSKISKIKISEDNFNDYSEDLELLLLENNVALEVAEKIISELKEKIVGCEINRKELENEIKNSLKGIIKEILIEPFDLIEEIKKKEDAPYVVLFCGVNGTGKTTTIAKIASLLKKNKISSVIAAGDTFRAASIEQIKKHGDKIGVNVISHDYGADPAAVGFDAIKYAKKNSVKCVLIDTAGRIHTAKNLLMEMGKIARVCNPDKKIFIGESITGNDAIEQVRAFNDVIKINGIILSKADIDEKGGTALSLGYVTKKPILFLGVGQNYEDLEVFNRDEFVEKLGL
jgi:fused signal recognition particle receptor